MEHSSLAKALVQFSKSVGAVACDSKNPHFKSRYASLKAIHNVVDPILAENGLTVMQFPISEGDQAGCLTIVMHESGETIEHPFTVPLSKRDPQAACAAVTYARRYGLSGALGIVTDEDDDGEAAMGRAAAVSNAGKPTPKARKAPAMSTANRDRVKKAADIRLGELDDESISQKDLLTEVAKSFLLSSPIEFTDDQFADVMDAVQKWEPMS